MKIRYEIKHEIDERLDIFLEHNGDYSKKLFSSSTWLKFIQETYKYRFFNVLFYKDGELIGFIPFFLVKGIFFGNRLMSLPFSAHGGGFCFKKDLKNNDLLEIIKLNTKAFSEITKKDKIKNSTIREINILQEDYKKEGYTYGEKEFTFLMELKSEEEMWKNLNKKVRNGIRKAEKEGLKFISGDSIDKLYKLHCKTMKRLGTPPVKKGHFKEIKKRFGKDYLIFFAEHKGEIIGDVTFILKDDHMFWCNNDCLKDYRGLNTSSFLLWESIKYGINKGYKFLDMGSSREDSNNYPFKIKWGKLKIFDVSKKYFSFESKSKIISPNNKEYQPIIFIWKNLIPEFLANIIGPKIRKNLGS
jgi:hypothetical protein